MDEEQKRNIDILLSIIALIVPLIIFIISSPERINPTTTIIFSAIAILILIFVFSSNIVSKWNKMNKNIQINNKKLDEIKTSLKYERLYNDMDVRMRIIERLITNKKGQIDPRILYWILIAILLYLFLKSIKVLP